MKSVFLKDGTWEQLDRNVPENNKLIIMARVNIVDTCYIIYSLTAKETLFRKFNITLLTANKHISLLMLLYNLLLVTLLKHLLTLEEICSFPMRKVFPIIFAMSRGSSGVRGPSRIFL